MTITVTANGLSILHGDSRFHEAGGNRNWWHEACTGLGEPSQWSFLRPSLIKSLLQALSIVDIALSPNHDAKFAGKSLQVPFLDKCRIMRQVFNDSVVNELPKAFQGAMDSSGLGAIIAQVQAMTQGVDTSQLAVLAPLLISSWQTAGQGTGAPGFDPALLGLALSKEVRIARQAVDRMSAHPPLLVMHNASSYHAFPAALSNLRQTVGKVQPVAGSRYMH